MAPQSFENLDFSFLIETENKIAYLQHWDEGTWSEAERYILPQALDALPKQTKLARAVKSFRGDAEYESLLDALQSGLVHENTPQRRSVWDLLQTCSRGLAARIVAFIYA